MVEYRTILHKYWGYRAFRPMQEEIIQSVLNGKDTLGLMPTAGGKSLTFQIPALALDGIAIVITPLIALMKDQVQRLQDKGIKAQAIYSGMTFDEITIALNNCLYGNYKFLYVSPERLDTDIFKARIKDMNLKLIAVDEAHCISQWGYDFRPSYLKIARLREYFPDIPVLALTATATPDIIDDIQEKLKFRYKNLLKSSFERSNLFYYVHYTENKINDIHKIVKSLKGSGIIYVRSRKRTGEVADFLKKNEISAHSYHAGLKTNIRSERQEEWTKNKVRVIVATNAFGMGIDKPDVRFVIHYDLPDSIESYFQEAGRAGRDGNKSFAILLYNESDRSVAGKRISTAFPEMDEIKHIYQSLGNYFQIPYGGGKGLVFDFNLMDFATHYKFNFQIVYSSLKIIEMQGYIELTEEINSPSLIKFLLERDELYKFQVANVSFDSFIKLVLRSFTGVFSSYTAINESLLAKRSGITIDAVIFFLKKLDNLKVIRYIPQKNSPLIIYNEERLDNKSLYISKENYKDRKELYIRKMNTLLNYASETQKCRNILLLEYFGESSQKKCGNCDVCKKEKQVQMDSNEFEMLKNEIISVILFGPILLKDLIIRIPVKADKLVPVIQWLLDTEVILYNKENKLFVNNKE